MEAYIIPDWLTIIAGLVIYRCRPENQVLFGLRSARQEKGKWCLPAGLGAIRRDISSALASAAPKSLKNPLAVVSALSKRQQDAFLTPAGFALAEAQWYVDLSSTKKEQLVPLKPVCRLSGEGLLIKLYFKLEWNDSEPPNPAKTEWPFEKVKFFSRKELTQAEIAFGCDEDLDEAFWQ